MSLSSAADAVYAYRFLRQLVTPWRDTDAYKHGIVDGNGKLLRPFATLKTSEEIDSYSYFIRLVFNIKRLIEKIPGGKSKIGTLFSALYLIKENGDLDESTLFTILDEYDSRFLKEDKSILPGDLWFILKNKTLSPGTYHLKETMVSPKTYEPIYLKGTKIIVDESSSYAVGSVMNELIYRAKHIQTNQPIYVSQHDIER